MNDLEKSNKDDAYNRIVRFYVDADIVLTADDEKILSRWIYCDALLRQRKFKTDEIIDKIKTQFHVSIYTAQNDIYKTQSLFAAARKISKEYLLNHHAEDIALQIERIKYDKSLVHLLPKLYDSYTKAIAAIPVEKGTNTLPPPLFIFNIAGEKDIQKPMSIEDARKKAQEKLKPPAPDDYTDFEDNPNES